MSVPNSKRSLTDWEKLADPSDADIDYSDIPPLDDEFFEHAKLRLPQDQAALMVRLDPDVLAWFRDQDAQYQQQINSVLRAYKEAHE